MKAISFLSSLLFALALNGQVQETIHQTFSVADFTVIELDLDGVVNVKERGGSRILVETSIDLDNGNDAVVDYLIDKGHYELSIVIKDGVATISKPKSNDTFILKGREVVSDEKLVYTIFVPSDLNVITKERTDVAAQ